MRVGAKVVFEGVTQRMSDMLQLVVELRNTQHSGKQSVPPRGSGWVRSWFLTSDSTNVRYASASSTGQQDDRITGLQDWFLSPC